MGKISEFTQEDYEVIARDYADLKEAARKRCTNENELDIIQKAFEFANEAHKGVRRRSGEPYILHPIAVAKIVVSNIGLGYKSIVAALLHDVVEDTDYTVDDLKSLFGEKVATLVKAYMEYGGHQLQINSVNSEKMKAAQEHPEDYPELIVRVWGWSGHFVEMPKCYQDQIIQRQEFGV